MSAEPSIDPRALTSSGQMGEGTRVLAFAFVADGAVIGRDCTIGEHAVVETDVVMGDEVVIGANATVSAGVAVGRGAVVESGAVVTHSIPANAIVQGNPARITAYVDGEPSVGDATQAAIPASDEAPQLRVPGVRLLSLTRAQDLRGSLMAIEFSELPFVPQRVFTVFGVVSEEIRGSHAHRETEQVLVAVAGSLSCVVDDGRVREEIRLDSRDYGLYIPPMIWATQYKYSTDGVLMVLASRPYDSAEYIRDYDELLRLQVRPEPLS